MTMPQKATPAYAGARFDAAGHCLVHRTVRLCQPTAEGRFRILRKTCPKCGTAALMTDAHNHRTSAHGYKKKTIRDREVRGHLTTTSGGEGDKHGRHHRGPKNNRHEPVSPRSGSRRRARTLSPRRSKSVHRSSQAKTPLSSSHVIRRKASGDKNIRGLVADLTSVRPPPFSRSSSDDSRPRYGKKGSVEGVGRCHVHPEVQLAIRRTSRGDGTWDIAKDGCPLCLQERGHRNSTKSTATRRSSRSKSTAAAILKSLSGDSKDARPENSPEDYFSTALVVYDPNAANNNNGTNEENKCSKTSSNNNTLRNRNILPNSTARMARIANRRGSGAMGRRSVPSRRSLRRRETAKENYEAWESLLVC